MKEILNKFTLKEAVSLVADGYRNVSTNKDYTAEERREGSRELLSELAKDYRGNKDQIFAIIEETLTQVLPERLEASIGRFAEVKNFAEGDTPKFLVKNGKITAYTVAQGGGVVRQRRDKATILVETEATQVKVYEELARVRAGLVDFNELMDDALDALEEEFYNKIYSAFKGTYANMPPANKDTDVTVVENKLDKLIAIVKSYGSPLIIGTSVGLSALPKLVADEANSDIYNQGFLGKYKGTPVVEMKNAVTDETNTKFQLDDRYLYIIPEGKDKIVKVAIEGDAYVRDQDGQDWTVNFEAMVQNGTAVLQNNHFCIYDNSSLAQA